MLTYYQKRRVIAKLKRVQNHVKHVEYAHYPAEVIYSGIKLIDQIICEHLDEPCSFVRETPLPKRVWHEKKTESGNR